MTFSLAQTEVLSETAERQVGHHPNYTGGRVRAARILARAGLLTPLDPDIPAGEAHQFVLTPAGADAYDELPARAKNRFAASGDYLTQYARLREQQAVTEPAGTGDVVTGEQRIVRQPRYDGYPVTEDDPDAETVIVADGVQIGGVYRAAGEPGGALPYDGAWVSWGVAGLSPGHPTRAAAEDVQIRHHIDFPVTATAYVYIRAGVFGWEPMQDEPFQTRVRSADAADLEERAAILEQIYRAGRDERVGVCVEVDDDHAVTVYSPLSGTGKVDTGGRVFERRPRNGQGDPDPTGGSVVVDDDGHVFAAVDRTEDGFAGGRWASRGPAGWSPGHATRSEAEDVQIAAYVSKELPATYIVEKDDLGDGELWEPVDKGDTRVVSASPIDLGVQARQLEVIYRAARCNGVDYRVTVYCEGRQVTAYSPPKSEPCGCEEHPLFTPFTVNAQGEPGQNNNLKISPEGPVTDPTLNDSPRVNEADPFTRDCDGVPLAAGNTVTVDLGAPHEPFTAIVHALDPFTLRSPDPVGPASYRNIRPDQVTLIESSAVRPPTVHLYQDSARGEYLYLQLTGVAGDPPILSHDFWHPGGFVPDADGWLSGAWDPAGRRDQVVLPAGAAGVTKVASHTLGGVPVLLVGLADLSDAAREYVDPAPDGVDPDAWEASREGTADELRGILAAVQARLAWLEARGLAETIRALTGHETG